MSNLSVVTVDRQALRAHFDAAVAEINPTRGGQLTTDFYTKTGDAVFAAGCTALDDHCDRVKRMHTLSAPAGAGKTSFSFASIAAVTRAAEENPEAPYGCLFVVEQITQADDAYLALNALLPGKVAVWTKEHSAIEKEWPKLAALGRTPSARFLPAALAHYPVAIVTHSFFMDKNSHHAVNVSRGGVFNPGSRRRALTIVDEQPQAVSVIDVRLSQAEAVRERLREEFPHAKEPINNLLTFMQKYPLVQSNKLFRPGMEIDQGEIREQLAWFGTAEAENVLKSLATDTPVKQSDEAADDDTSVAAAVFQFAHLLSLGFGLDVLREQQCPFLRVEEQAGQQAGARCAASRRNGRHCRRRPRCPLDGAGINAAGELPESGDCPRPQVDQSKPQAIPLFSNGLTGVSAADAQNYYRQHRA